MNTMIRAFSIAALLVIISGCGQQQTTVDEAPVSPPLNESKAVAIARKAVEERTGSSKNKKFEVSRDGSDWKVLVLWEPAMPGGHAFITIDQNGKLTEYSAGE